MGKRITNIVNSPIKGIDNSWCSSSFGYREFTYKGVVHKGQHNGLDLTSGDVIIAPARGKVTAVRNSILGYTEKEASGNYVTLYHGNNAYTAFLHLVKGSVKVKVGQIVEKGQELGLMGSTGFSTGKHLHYAVNVNGKYVNPEAYLLGTAVLPEYNVVVNNNTTYKVVRNDSLGKISTKFGVTVNELLVANKSKYPAMTRDFIRVGWELVIPKKSTSTSVSGFRVGDKVKIIKRGNANSNGTGLSSGGIGWVRKVIGVMPDKAYSIRVGDNTGTTGWFKPSSLQKM